MLHLPGLVVSLYCFEQVFYSGFWKSSGALDGVASSTVDCRAYDDVENAGVVLVVNPQPVCVFQRWARVAFCGEI